jgi:hypothetical protein
MVHHCTMIARARMLPITTTRSNGEKWQTHHRASHLALRESSEIFWEFCEEIPVFGLACV